MTKDYYYPQVTGGFRWNMLQRIKNTIGKEPISTNDVFITGLYNTVITFDKELTLSEKILVDSVMSDNPTFPPTNYAIRFKIEDIWERLETFKTNTGIPWSLYYSSSTVTGIIDTIEIQSPINLTNSQKNSVKLAYANLIKEI